MNDNASGNSNTKKSMIIGFIIGFVLAFTAVYWWFNRSLDNSDDKSDEPTAGELMQQQAAANTETADESLLSNNKTAVSAPDKSEAFAAALIARMFSNDEVARKDAKKELAKNFHDNSVVMAKLIQVCSNEFDKKDRFDNGIFQGIDVFSMVAEKNPATLREHKDALYEFFDKTKGQYRESTQERIEKIKGLLESDM